MINFWTRYTKWSLVEIYHFNGAYYSVQVRQNIKTGFKQFRCNKIVPAHYGGSDNLTPERIESLTGPKSEAPKHQSIEEVARLFNVPVGILQKMQTTSAFSIVEAADEYVFQLMQKHKIAENEAPTCATCGSTDTYTATAYHCMRCATTTEI